ncbi:hypothetical protein JCM18899A_40690 [Nocardioides sp. AN3]
MSQRHAALISAAPFVQLAGGCPDHEAELADAELCHAIREGRDRHGAAVAELYRRHAALALGHARQLSRGAANSEDVVADAFLKTWQRLASGHEIDSFPSYLLRAVRNGFVDSLRQRARLVSLETVIEAHPSTGGAVADPTVSVDDADLLRTVVERLSPRHRHALWLRAVEGYSTSEVAELLGLKPNAAAALLHRAHKALAAAHRSVEDHAAAC